MSSQLNSRSFGLVALAVAWALFLSAIGSPEVILFTIPVFMIAAPLAFGIYAGEELITRLAGIGRRSKRRSAWVGTVSSRPVAFVRSNLLIASNLAGRAPPLATP